MPCGLTFAQRLKTVDVHGKALETRTKVSYYDHDAVDEQFGGTAKERREEYLDRSHGFKEIRHLETGGAMYTHHKTGERRFVSDETLVKTFGLDEDR